MLTSILNQMKNGSNKSKSKILETIVDFLDRTFRQISNRTFTIKNASDWRNY